MTTRLPPPVSTFFTISVIAQSSMHNGRCIDCAEAIGQQHRQGRIDSLSLVARSPHND
jgi:hypothetical protein